MWIEVILLTSGLIQGFAVTDIPSNAPGKNQAILRIPANVIAGRILTHPMPVCPKDAKKKHITGQVVLQAIIGTDGKIQQLVALTGPEELRDSALDAVQRWTYLPYEVSGRPVEVDTTITVSYNMGRQPDSRANGSSLNLTTGEETIELPADAKELRKVKKITAAYPQNAREQGIAGNVLLSINISKDGHVETTDVISGPEPLRDAAVEAVRQWVYPPYKVKGEFKRVHTLVTVSFPSD
jgi:TonB family protein